ncbi:hypothetical protein BM221_006257 [Beauveria bassiana]|uniref:Uncharacterized protein n=1 Tax=Beauveria bassiana TaxID=176275 RepID=A0A2N6NLC7_BEABA|nr:hypothetical protein BM221_006257 [Beauveria bassiana]
MDRLSQEIIDRIAALLPEEKLEMTGVPAAGNSTSDTKSSMVKKLMCKMRRGKDNSQTQQQRNALSKPSTQCWTRAAAATISLRWQRAIEPIVYANLHLGYSGLANLRSALQSRSERRAYLRSLTVVLALTHEHWTGLGVRQDALQPLFDALGGGGEDRNAGVVDLTLRFRAGHPDLRHRTCQGIVFDRHHPGKPLLGAMPCIGTLDFTPARPTTKKERRNVLQLHLTEQAQLVARCPNLQAVVWHYAEEQIASQAVRDAARDAFADCMVEQLAPRRRITKVSLTLRIGRLGLCICAPSSVGADSYEDLYKKLRAATTHAADFCYAGVVGPSLLHDDGDAGCWLALRNLTVGMALLTPAGQFYFGGDAALPPIDLDTPLGWRVARHDGERSPGRPLLFRETTTTTTTMPEEATMGPLLSAFAQLLARLPVLETANLLARCGGGAEEEEEAVSWAVCYCAPGRTSAWVGSSGMDMERPRVWFVTRRWRPEDGLVRAFRRAGEGAGHGDRASVIYWSAGDASVRI